MFVVHDEKGNVIEGEEAVADEEADEAIRVAYEDEKAGEFEEETEGRERKKEGKRRRRKG